MTREQRLLEAYRQAAELQFRGRAMIGPGSAAPQCGASNDSPTRHQIAPPRAEGAREPKGWYSRGYLPHFDVPHVLQHITYRLDDALPSAALERLQAEVESLHLEPRQHEAEMRRRIEDWLDAGHGSCVLRDPAIAACIVDTWYRFDGERYRLLEWVVMPNHCHVLIEPLEGVALGRIVLSWKNFTARFINERLRRTGVRRSRGRSRVWQREYWDRFIRDQHHLHAVRHYIQWNPVKAGLVLRPEDWPWSSAQGQGTLPEPWCEGADP